MQPLFSTEWERLEYEKERAAKKRTRDMEVALWAAWKELNEIRARDGVPYTHQGYKASVDEGYFSQVVDACEAVLGDDTMPWPAKRWLEQDGELILPSPAGEG